MVVIVLSVVSVINIVPLPKYARGVEIRVSEIKS